MNAYRVAADVPQDDLRALVAEATEQVRRQRLERRLAWCNSVLGKRRPALDNASAPKSKTEDSDVIWPVALILGLLALPLLVLGIYIALLLYACASLVRARTEWRLYGSRKSPRPIASACVLASLLSFGAFWFAATVGDATSSLAVAALVLGLVCAVVAARRREWSNIEHEGDHP